MAGFLKSSHILLHKCLMQAVECYGTDYCNPRARVPNVKNAKWAGSAILLTW